MAIEFSVVISAEGDFAGMVCGVVAQGARLCGSDEQAALSFGGAAEDAVRDMVARLDADARVSIVVRMQDGPMRVVIGSSDGATRTLTLGL